ncbi:MAG: hypothetical protein J6K52_05900 [Clostridia bacterium]|nr:hypothetical protein [Clostridia bacterium]
MEILIGVIGSLIASFVWWGLAQLYSVDSREKINYQLMLLRNDNALYEKCLEYKDYDLALSQSQRMLVEIGEIISLIKPWTYFPKKRKLINTLLENLHRTISRFQLYYKGYDSETEKEHCCYEAKRHLYVVGYESDDTGKYPDPNKFQSVSSVTISLLSDLNIHKCKSVGKILTESFCFNCSNVSVETRKKYYFDLIEANSFKNSYSKIIANKFQTTNDILTREQYGELINSLEEKSKKK